ncbi:hypothetical protein MP228_005660 [Amoeboaphelidium protococcarum]|nr:hypothetical protein MP228_005660 [Amoeboaphelidium protococcarum]
MAYNGFGEYMQIKQQKLMEQQQSQYGDILREQKQSDTFRGCVFYATGNISIDGRGTDDIKQLIILNGGVFSNYETSQVTHIIAQSLSFSRYRQLFPQKFKSKQSKVSSSSHSKQIKSSSPSVIKPSWLLKCIESGKVLPIQESDIPQWSSAPSAQTNVHSMLYTSGNNNKFVDSKSAGDQSLQMGDSSSQFSVKQQQQKSNQQQQLQSSDQWKRQNSSMNAEFVSQFYSQSRLHYLSTWKQKISEYSYSRIQNQDGKQPSSAISKQLESTSTSERCIIHIDLDCFFASVSLLKYPELKDKPVVICHHNQSQDQSKSGPSTSSSIGKGGSEIASCNYAARQFGIHNGMYLRKCKQLCPHLVMLPYDFDAYESAMLRFYECLSSFEIYGLKFDALQGVSCDEAYLDCTSMVQQQWSSVVNDKQLLQPENNQFRRIASEQYDGDIVGKDTVLQVALKLQRDVMESVGVDASIGVGPSMLLARQATRKSKPHGIFITTVTDDNDHSRIQQFMDDFKIEDLQQIGYSIVDKLKKSPLNQYMQKNDEQSIQVRDLRMALTRHTSSSISASNPHVLKQSQNSFNTKCLDCLKKIIGEKTGLKLFAMLHGYESVQERGLYSFFQQQQKNSLAVQSTSSHVNSNTKGDLIGVLSSHQVAEDCLSVAKTVSAEINWGIRFESYQQLDIFMLSLYAEVCQRLCKTQQDKIDTFSRQQVIDYLAHSLPQDLRFKQITLKLRMRHPNAELEPSHKSLGCGMHVPFSKSLKVPDNFSFVQCFDILHSLNNDDERGSSLQLQQHKQQNQQDCLMDQMRQMWWQSIGRNEVWMVEQAASVGSMQEPESAAQSRIFLRDLRGIGIQFSQIYKAATQDSSLRKSIPELQRDIVESIDQDMLHQTQHSQKKVAQQSSANKVNAPQQPQMYTESQLDWDVMKELPSDIRNEVLEYVSPTKGVKRRNIDVSSPSDGVKQQKRQQLQQSSVLSNELKKDQTVNDVKVSHMINFTQDDRAFPLQSLGSVMGSQQSQTEPLDFDIDLTLAAWTAHLEQDYTQVLSSVDNTISDAAVLGNMEYLCKVRDWLRDNFDESIASSQLRQIQLSLSKFDFLKQ